MTGGISGAWQGTLKPGYCVPSSASEPRHSSHPPWSSCAQALCDASVGTSRQRSTCEVSQLSAIPCRSRHGAQALPGALVSRQTDRVPLSPFPKAPAWLHWFVLIPFCQGSHWISSVIQSSLMLTNSAHVWERNLHRADCEYATWIVWTEGNSILSIVCGIFFCKDIVLNYICFDIT